MNEAARNIVAILDLDGYMVDGKFAPKELALKGLGDPKPFSCFFYNNNKRFKDFSIKDKRSANWVYHNIFDIHYEKYWHGMLTPDSVNRVLEVLKKPEEPWVVGYKGGHFEKDLLDHLNIPSFNLELLGCPKVETIPHSKTYRDCGHHRKSTIHCPAVEVQLFDEWFKDYMNNQELTLQFERFNLDNPRTFLKNHDFAIKM